MAFSIRPWAALSALVLLFLACRTAPSQRAPTVLQQSWPVLTSGMRESEGRYVAQQRLAQWDGGSGRWGQSYFIGTESDAPPSPMDSWGSTMRVAGAQGVMPRWLRRGQRPQAGSKGDVLGGRWSNWIGPATTFIPSRLQDSDNAVPLVPELVTEVPGVR